jgi:hypothetical protein
MIVDGKVLDRQRRTLKSGAPTLTPLWQYVLLEHGERNTQGMKGLPTSNPSIARDICSGDLFDMG